MYNKILTLLLFTSFTTTQGIFASTFQEEDASKTTLNSPAYSIAMYSHELAKLVSQKETITQKYAPNNIARKSFNDLKSTDTVTIKENDYSIEGLRDVTEEKAYKKRKDFLDSLPHDYAVASNTFMGLKVRGISVDPAFYVQIQYTYTPGPLDFSGTKEYFLTVETPLNYIDLSNYKKFSQQIAELTYYQVLDSHDHAEDLQYKVLWDETKNPSTHYEKLRAQAQLTLKKTTEDYARLRKVRLELLSSYTSLEEQDRNMLRYFNFQTLEYRRYLSETALVLANTTDESKFSDILRELQSNSKRFSEPLLEFPEWFETKDTQAEVYQSIYSKWK
ncbi:MAG: hypothetical protein BGO76_07375 [Caedibacter sp. 38-128]|nr:hypothetical protein [Holosporales bacterium]OJX04828.1 MAG: hypothetical protein BGO76_07375 [Caedibacter sp. 38-128]